MSLYKTYKTSNEKENNGIPIKFPGSPTSSGKIPTFYVGRISKKNKRFQKVTDQLYKPYRKNKNGLKNMSDEVAEDILKKSFIKGCLRGWENIENADGVEIPFTEENADKLFSDLPDLFEHLMEQANDLSLYLDEQLEEEVKN